jgi:lipopolysaccharide export LptBFGC system permease protein LptF
VSDDVELDGDEQEANSFSIKYSDYNTASYTYNAETKRYLRYTRGIKQVDWNTNEDVTVKNIIITFVKNTTLDDGENKGRQTLDNVGTRDGYYITNGKAIKIKCEKKSRTEQTVYKDLNGNEIKVNDGNTFIQICPIDAEVTFK